MAKQAEKEIAIFEMEIAAGHVASIYTDSNDALLGYDCGNAETDWKTLEVESNMKRETNF